MSAVAEVVFVTYSCKRADKTFYTRPLFSVRCIVFTITEINQIDEIVGYVARLVERRTRGGESSGLSVSGAREIIINSKKMFLNKKRNKSAITL